MPPDEPEITFCYILMLRKPKEMAFIDTQGSLVSLSRQFILISVLAPIGEILSFASPRQLLLRCSNSCIRAVEKKVSKEKATRIPPSSLGTSMCLALRVRCMQISYPADLSCASRSCALWVFGEGFRRAIPGPAKTSGMPDEAGQALHTAPLAGLFHQKL